MQVKGPGEMATVNRRAITDATPGYPKSSKVQIHFGKAILRRQGCTESIIEKFPLN